MTNQPECPSAAWERYHAEEEAKHDFEPAEEMWAAFWLFLSGLYGGDADVATDVKAQVERGVYKYTGCGASAYFVDCYPDNPTILLSSIVEGVEQTTETHALRWPFTEAEWWEALEYVETEAGEIWAATHVGRHMIAL
jgi:hypothetical protein